MVSRSLGIPLERQRGIVRCDRCGHKWGENDELTLAEACEAFKKHLPECQPDFKPRPIEQIRRELDRKRREKKKEQEKQRARLTASKSEKPQKPKKKSGPPSRQPALTDEMIGEIRRSYTETRNMRRAAEHCYASFGFSSTERLKVALRKACKERGIVIAVPQNQSRLSEEMFREARRLCEEERVSIWEISRRYHKSWGYSWKGLKIALYQAFRAHGVNYKRKGTVSQRKMPPDRVEVAWYLYSVGNYSLREITEVSHEFWGVSKSWIRETLKKNGYELRPSKWEPHSQAIKRETAIELIKSVS